MLWLISAALAGPPSIVDLTASAGQQVLSSRGRAWPNTAVGLQYGRCVLGPAYVMFGLQAGLTQVPAEEAASPVDHLTLRQLVVARPSAGVRFMGGQRIMPFAEAQLQLPVLRTHYNGRTATPHPGSWHVGLGAAGGVGVSVGFGKRIHLGLRADAQWAGGLRDVDLAQPIETQAARDHLIGWRGGLFVGLR